MSHSRKKPIFKESGHVSNKERKTRANQRLRRHLSTRLRGFNDYNDPEDYDDDYQNKRNKRYRLFTDPWNISDYELSEYLDTKRPHDQKSEDEFMEFWSKIKRK